MRRKRSVMLLICLGVLSFSGCAQISGQGMGNDAVAETTGHSAWQEEKTGTVEKTTLTAEQEALLVKISVDEERVRSGELYGWQKKVIRQYDAAMDYLGKKYPSHSFEITDCAQKDITNSFSTFWFLADGEDVQYELYLYIEDDDTYCCEDNFYGALLEEPYAQALQELIAAEEPGCIGVVSRISTARGEEFGEKMTAEEILSETYKMTNSTDLYVDGRNGDAQALAERVGAVVKSHKIYGAYTVYVLDNLPMYLSDGSAIAAYVEENPDAVSLKQSFQQFD